MQEDFIIDCLGFCEAEMDRGYRRRAVTRLVTFIRFLQENGLTTRTMLEPGRKPTGSTEIRNSDLTTEGQTFVKTYNKWYQQVNMGASPKDTTMLAQALARLRGLPVPPVRDLTATAQAAGHKKTPRRSSARTPKRRQQTAQVEPEEELDEELLRELEAAGPHVYDKAKYHYEGDYPKGLSKSQAFVYAGLFIGWLIDHNMIAEEFLPEAERFKRREINGAQVYKIWDGGLDSDMLTAEGNRFARDYFDPARGIYAEDFAKLLAKKLPSIYHVKDTRKNYETIKRRIDERYQRWKRKRARNHEVVTY